jgi:glycosyltransferase involved in cell wall biosynthesis
MFVSVIIPTYNRKLCLFQAVDSVLAQTVPVEEIIVVDDGSTDGTFEAVCARYGALVKAIRQDNSGASAARNRGLREARGEWIALLDSDDVWLPMKIERQLEALARFGGKSGLCFTDNIFIGDPNMTRSVFEATGFVGGGGIGILEEPAKYILTKTEPFYTSSCLIRHSLIRESGGFDKSLIIREDTDLFFRICFRTKLCYVAEKLVQIDRTPSREVGLCNLYATRDDQKHDSLVNLYSKWLAMPEVAGTGYEQPVRELLRLAYYNSAEDKLRQLRIGPALSAISRLRDIESGYASIAGTFFLRKIQKLRRHIGD